MVELFANSGDPDQTQHSAVSDLGQHCLPVTVQRSPVFSGLKGKKFFPFRVGSTLNVKNKTNVFRVIYHHFFYIMRNTLYV